MTKYDVVIIGSGPAGYMAASLLGRRGQSVLVVEKGNFGGTCVNFGCVPSIFLHDLTLLLSRGKEQDRHFGIVRDQKTANYVERVMELRGRLSEAGEELVRSSGADIMKGEATIQNDFVVIGGVRVGYERLILASGSTPDLSLKKEEAVYNEDQLAELDSVPETMIVVGGGYAGVEISQFYAKLGSRVTLLTEGEVVGNLGSRLSHLVREALSWDGVEVKEHVHVSAVKAKEVLTNLGSFKAQIVLLAAGRKPNLPSGINVLGVQLSPKGVIVDNHMRTSNPRVWAAGDIISKDFHRNAHSAMAEAIVASSNIVGRDLAVSYDAIPDLIYTDPEIGVVGDSKTVETWAEFPFRANTRAIISGFTEGYVKIGFDSFGRVVYGEAVGQWIEEFLNLLSILVKFRVKKEDLSNLTLLHPSLGESIISAVRSLSNEDVERPLRRI